MIRRQKMKIQETLVNKDDGVHLLNFKSERKSREIRKHLTVLYTLLFISFGLHTYVIINGSQFYADDPSSNDYEDVEAEAIISEAVIKERGRRHTSQDDHQRRNIDSSQIPTANVEFVHPKLKDEMKDDEDPQNPWVWLTSFSRVPVRIVLEIHLL